MRGVIGLLKRNLYKSVPNKRFQRSTRNAVRNPSKVNMMTPPIASTPSVLLAGGAGAGQGAGGKCWSSSWFTVPLIFSSSIIGLIAKATHGEALLVMYPITFTT